MCASSIWHSDGIYFFCSWLICDYMSSWNSWSFCVCVELRLSYFCILLKYWTNSSSNVGCPPIVTFQIEVLKQIGESISAAMSVLSIPIAVLSVHCFQLQNRDKKVCNKNWCFSCITLPCWSMFLCAQFMCHPDSGVMCLYRMSDWLVKTIAAQAAD